MTKAQRPDAGTVLALTFLLSGCGGVGTTNPASGPPNAPGAGYSRAANKITHIVVIVQENRTVDDLFQFLPGANTQSWGYNTQGQKVYLQPEPLTASYGLSHHHSDFLVEYDGGKMDGFNNEHETCFGSRRKCPDKSQAAYAYVPQSGVEPYYTMAESYTFADNMFETNQGPSFPAHQYIVSGTSSISSTASLLASENARGPQNQHGQGGCDSIPGSTVLTINHQGKEVDPVFPCFERLSIMDLMNSHYVSWHYYQEKRGAGVWNAVDAIEQVREGPSYSNVITPSRKVIRDIDNGRLPSVTFVTPSIRESDHPAEHAKGTGPSWVASVVNALGASPYWQSTAIIVVWDDWGGWYDHVTPVVRNSYELGMRVPMIVISPYAKKGHVSHVAYEFGSILKFIEETFGLPSLDTTDKNANDLADCFNFSASPRPFKTIPAPYSAQHFLNEPEDPTTLDY